METNTATCIKRLKATVSFSLYHCGRVLVHVHIHIRKLNLLIKIFVNYYSLFFSFLFLPFVLRKIQRKLIKMSYRIVVAISYLLC